MGFFKNKNNRIDKVQEKYEIIINDIDTFALCLKNREEPYLLIRDKNFPFMLKNTDIEWIDMNKKNFDYYEEFSDISTMFKKLQQLYNEEETAKKKEEDYLIDYLKHSDSGYSQIVDKMESIKIDKNQYDNFLKDIKSQIKSSIETLYNNYEKYNNDIETNRTYKEIMNNLMSFNDFSGKYSYKDYEKIRHTEGSISHCGYPDYMWQSGAERRLYKYSTNS